MSYIIHRLSVETNKEELLKFWNENHEKSLDEKYRWWYEGNPAGKATVFVIRDDQEDNIIGCFAVFPRRVAVNGTNLRAGIAGDFLVHSKHRVLGPALKLGRQLVSLVEEGEFDLIYGFPNKSAEPVMRRAGFKYLGPSIRIAKIVKISRYLRKFQFYRYLDRLLSPLLDVGARLLALETWYRFKGAFACEEIGDFDERFDELWMRSKSRFQAVGERTSELLEWRFRKEGNIEYRIFAILNSDRTELKGYIIYCMDEYSIDICDFVLPEDKKAIRVLMTHFLRHVRETPVKSVVMHFMENKEVQDAFRRFGFVKRKSDWSVYYCCKDDVLKRFPALVDSENWLLSGFDTDSFRI